MKLLSQYAQDVLQRASMLNHYASDVFLARDDLVRPFGRLNSDKAELQKLKHDVVFEPGLRLKMEQLDAKIDSNEHTLDLLEKECAAQGMTDRFCLQALREKLRFIAEQIEFETGHYNDRIRPYREAAAKLGDSRLADSNPIVIAAKQEYDSRCDNLRKEYGKISDNIESLQNILRSLKW